MSAWQSEEQRCATVLREVFGWLTAEELAQAGGVCRAWRRAAAEPSLWRRLLCRHAHVRPYTLRALADLRPADVCWRQEYVAACAGWRLVAQHGAGGGATLLHAALSPDGSRLALGAADGAVALWRRGGDGVWYEAWRRELASRGWAAVARVAWAARAARLLLAGPRALVDDWELLVLRLRDDEECGEIECRVRCSAGAAGCWADDGYAFLSLELRRLGAGLYCTTVRLNAASQEMQSEYAGVTAPLLRIYNEDGAHISHALVASASDDDDDSLDDNDIDVDGGPGRAYLRAIEVRGGRAGGAGGTRLLLAGGGRVLGAWAVRAARPPPVQARAAGGLAERVRLHRERRAQPAEEAPEPDEVSVRAACTPPVHKCRLPAPLVGLVLHERGRCAWVVCGDGSAVCVSLGLRVLCRVRAPEPPPAPAVAHYVQPAVTDTLLASPVGGCAARVWWCSAASCARRGSRRGALALRAAAVCALLPPADARELLVLAGDHLYVWRSRATSQCGH